MPQQIDYVETGTGAPVLFLPGSFSTPAAWKPMQSSLPDGYRHVSTSFCGYGGTAETRTLQDCGFEHQVDIVARVARQIGEPVHLVGHSMGGTVALLALLRGQIDAISLTTYEANPFPILRGGPQHHMVGETLEMSAAFEAAYHANDPDAAGQIIDFWGGAGSFASLPSAVQDYCRDTCFANVLDWRGVHQVSEQPADFADIDLPVLLVRGGNAAPVMHALTETLHDALPNARSVQIDGASHFLISTHARQCAELLSEVLDTKP